MLMHVGIYENEARGGVGLVHFPVEFIFGSLAKVAPGVGTVEFAGSNVLKEK